MNRFTTLAVAALLPAIACSRSATVGSPSPSSAMSMATNTRTIGTVGAPIGLQLWSLRSMRRRARRDVQAHPRDGRHARRDRRPVRRDSRAVRRRPARRRSARHVDALGLRRLQEAPRDRHRRREGTRREVRRPRLVSALRRLHSRRCAQGDRRLQRVRAHDEGCWTAVLLSQPRLRARAVRPTAHCSTSSSRGRIPTS